MPKEFEKELKAANEAEMEAATAYNNAETNAFRIRKLATARAHEFCKKEKSRIDTKYSNALITVEKVYEESTRPTKLAYRRAKAATLDVIKRSKQKHATDKRKKIKHISQSAKKPPQSPIVSGLKLLVKVGVDSYNNYVLQQLVTEASSDNKLVRLTALAQLKRDYPSQYQQIKKQLSKRAKK